MATDGQLHALEAARAKAYTPEANAKRTASRAATMKRKKREAKRAAREGTPPEPDPAHTPEANAKRRATWAATRERKAAAKAGKSNGGNGHAMSIPLDAIPDRMPPTPPRRMVATNAHAGNGARTDRNARLMLAAGLIQLLQTILE